MSTLINTIVLDYDLIEIHYNALLKNKPYLVRIYNWNDPEPNEIRLDQDEIQDLYSILRENNLI